MTDDRTTQAPLCDELAQLRQRVAELEASQAEYQHLAAALRDSQERYRDLFENANDLIQSVSPDGHYLYVNRTWHETLGYSASDLEAMTIFDIIAPECQATCRLEFQRVMAGEKPDRVETTLLAKDGRRILLEGSVNCQVVNGHPVATRGIFRNITARKRAEMRLARLNECFLGFGPDPLGNINQITMTCGELLQADVALYNRLDAGLLCAWGQWRTPDDFQAVDRPEGHICFDVINRGTDDVVLIRDLLHSSYAQTDPNVNHYGLQTYFGRAVKFNGVAVG
ncbi:MAG: PAS domain S-box protein, partial [Thermoflexales bacterium]|nr:PAS domain S-box protein [Thermoflexales bacterium]